MSRLTEWLKDNAIVDKFLQWPTAGVMVILACAAFYASRKARENPLGEGLAVTCNIVGFIFLAPLGFWMLFLLDVLVLRPSFWPQ